MNTFAVLGGDLRCSYLAGLLAEDGFSVISSGFDNADLPDCVTGCTEPIQAMKSADCIVLPLPATTDGIYLNAPFARNPMPIEDLVAGIGSHQVVVGGQLRPPLLQALSQRGVRAYDYFVREELKIRNAVPTAEGALQLAMEELPATLYGANCLITGYGRIGRTLARRLSALGARVTVAARRTADRALASTHGCATVSTENLRDSGDFDVIFNTVPALLFNDAYLATLSRRTLLIDLASRPGGVDFGAAAARGIKTIWALSLPGRVAPKTAGEIIKDTILNILQEEGEGL